MNQATLNTLSTFQINANLDTFIEIFGDRMGKHLWGNWGRDQTLNVLMMWNTLSQPYRKMLVTYLLEDQIDEAIEVVKVRENEAPTYKSVVKLNEGVTSVSTTFGRSIKFDTEANVLMLCRWTGTGIKPIQVCLPHQVYEHKLTKILEQYPDTREFAVIPYTTKPIFFATVSLEKINNEQ